MAHEIMTCCDHHGLVDPLDGSEKLGDRYASCEGTI